MNLKFSRKKCRKSLVFLSLLLILILNEFSYAAASNKKSIVFIIDEISLEDLLNSQTPNIDSLADRGNIGLINVRAKSRVSNKGSNYLSLGSGVRTLASTQGKLAFNRDFKQDHNFLDENEKDLAINSKELYELYSNRPAPDGDILNIAIEDIDRTAYSVTPNNEIGLLGKIAKKEGLKIAALGNSDANGFSREFTMLAMDEKGSIPLGNVDSDLLKYDPNILGHLSLDQEKTLSEFDRVLPESDIIFINYGDTVRVQRSERLANDKVREEQKIKTIEEADSFLGEILDKVDLNNTMVSILIPNPSKSMVRDGNFGLTPILISKPGDKGNLLTSNTTRRKGVITNFDFAPTILSFFGVENLSDFIGEDVSFIENENPVESLQKIESQSLYLRKFRKVFHWIFIGLIILVTIAIFLPIFIKKLKISSFFIRHESFFNKLALTLLTIPITMITLPLIGYKNIVIDVIYVFLGAFTLAYIVSKISRSKFKSVAFLSLTTSFLILLDSFVLKELMIISPLGSDAIAGGRFYGIGNDYMGILIGASILGLFSIFSEHKLSKSKSLIIMVLAMFIVILGLSPIFGANMGGTLAATGTLLIAGLIILNKKISFKKLVLLGLAIVIFILAVAIVDYLFNPNPTHAGKAILAIKTGNFSKLIEIISIKLRQVFWNLFNASWNMVLFMHIILLGLIYKFKKQEANLVKEENIYMFNAFKTIVFASILIFLFNDTGTIAAAISLSYALIPLGLYIRKVSA